MAPRRNIKLPIMAVAGALAISVGVWYWWSRRTGTTTDKEVTVREKKEVTSYTTDEILEIMDDIIKMQRENGAAVKAAAEMIIKEDASVFEGQQFKKLVRRTYNHCKSIPLSDLTEKWGISPDDFDEMARRCENDPRAKQRIEKILQGPLDQDKDVDWSRAELLKIEDIMQINEEILGCLEKVMRELSEVRREEVFDNKAASYTAQAISHAFAMKVLNIDTRVVDRAIEAHQTELVDLPRFVDAHHKLQQILNSLESSS